MKMLSRTFLVSIIILFACVFISGCSSSGKGSNESLSSDIADNSNLASTNDGNDIQPGGTDTLGASDGSGSADDGSISDGSDSNSQTGDDGDDSSSDPINGIAANYYPVADAGTSQTATVNSLADLDGSASYDPDHNYPLTYRWQFIAVPAGSIAVLSGDQESAASFVVDLAGDYQIELIVTDSLGATSDPAVVTISTINSAPIADAGPDQRFTQAGTEIFLDGSKSFDLDGDTLEYAWVLSAKPAASAAELAGAASVHPSFAADLLGTYTVELVVSDPSGATSTTDSVVISSDNIAPVAHAGYNQVVLVDDMIFLDGSGSYDANSDPLTYWWSMTSQPSDSTAMLIDPDLVDPYFIVDLQGAYNIGLIVDDGLDTSIPDAITVLAVDANFVDDFVSALMQAMYAINQLEDEDFVNSNNRNALTNKIIAVLSNYLKGEFSQSTVDKLVDDIGGKMDGFIQNNPPSLDANDWIVDPDGQLAVYPFIQMADDYLQDFLN